jgi:SAM-dependent methyltransferase
MRHSEDTDMADLKTLAERVGRDWVDGTYYDQAEVAFDYQWQALIWPIIKDSDFSSTLEIAPGHGRNTAKLLPLANELFAVDINQTNIEFLKQRFRDEAKLHPIRNNGYDLASISSESISFVYCFDSMVHFYADVVQAYVKEIRRVMIAGARGFVHYSNNHRDKNANYRDHPGWRNFMSRDIFESYLLEEELHVIRSLFVTTGGGVIPEDNGDCDAVTLFELR